MITESDISTYQLLYRKHFEREIDREEAKRRLTLLVKQVEQVFASGQTNLNLYEDNDEQERPELYS